MMTYKDYTWEEILHMNPLLEDNKIIIVRHGKTYEAKLRVNHMWRLHEIK